jgi:hypothetical protein
MNGWMDDMRWIRWMDTLIDGRIDAYIQDA